METPLNNLRITPRSNLPKIKDGAYVINYDEYATVGTRLITIYVKTDLATYFASFGIEHIPKEVKKFVGKVIRKYYRIQAHDSIMCGYFCIGFIGFMQDNKRQADFTNLFSPDS